MRWALFSWIAFAVGCGGGGGGGPDVAFGISGTTPEAGSIDASTADDLVITFTRPADLDTVTTQSFFVETGQGQRVPGSIITRDFTPTSVRFQPVNDLENNSIYRVTITQDILSSGGTPLPQTVSYTFVTSNPTPTVRPDQLVDLGNALTIGRDTARGLLVAGKFFVFGGYSDPNTVTDTVEVYDPDRRTFDHFTTGYRAGKGDKINFG